MLEINQLEKEIQDTQTSIEQQQAYLVLKQQLETLHAIPEFKQLIIQGYCDTTMEKAIAFMANEHTRPLGSEMIIAVAKFRDYLNQLQVKCNRANEMIKELEEELAHQKLTLVEIKSEQIQGEY